MDAPTLGKGLDQASDLGLSLVRPILARAGECEWEEAAGVKASIQILTTLGLSKVWARSRVESAARGPEEVT